MSGGPKDNFRRSELLTAEENDHVRGMLGGGCKSLATSVVQLFVTQPPSHDEWIKKDAGIICLVRDNTKRSFSLRLFSIGRNALVWEQEIYKNMKYDAPMPFLHVLEGEQCAVALNFASETEAQLIYKIITRKLDKSRQKESSDVREDPVTSTSTSAAQPVEDTDDQKAGPGPKPADPQDSVTTTPSLTKVSEPQSSPPEALTENDEGTVPGAKESPSTEKTTPDDASPAPEFASPPPEVASPPPEVATPPPEVASPPPEVATPPPDDASPPPEVATPPPDDDTPPPVDVSPPPDDASPPPEVTMPPPDDASPPPVDASPPPDDALPAPDDASPPPDDASPPPDDALLKPPAQSVEREESYPHPQEPPRAEEEKDEKGAEPKQRKGNRA